MVCGLQAFNPLYQEKVIKVLQDSGKGGVYYIAHDILFFKDRVIILAQGALRRKLLKGYYNNPRAGHKGAGQILKLLSRNFHWVKIVNNIRRYIFKYQMY